MLLDSAHFNIIARHASTGCRLTVFGCALVMLLQAPLREILWSIKGPFLNGFALRHLWHTVGDAGFAANPLYAC
jgi:hypothetical protein